MSFYRRVGDVPETRHTQFRQPNGDLYHEELIGAEGFAGEYSLLYHASPPTRVRAVKAQRPVALTAYSSDVHRHHRMHTSALEATGDFSSARIPLFFNSDIVFSVATPDSGGDALYRNGECDELVYVHEGAGELLSAFGSIAYKQYDWVHIPRGVTIQWNPTAGKERLVIIESYSPIRPPSHYVSANGQLLEASPYCERDIRGPEQRTPIEGSIEVEVRLKTRDLITSYWLDRHPFDVVGWDGYYYPYALNALAFQPITQRIHTMPNMHQIFATQGAAICNLIPRMADYHPLSIPSAPNHSSVDCDEVLYMVAGRMTGRNGDEPGTTTFHPRGLPHGPQTGAYERSIGVSQHESMSLMVDTFRRLQVAQEAMACDDPGYPSSWAN